MLSDKRLPAPADLAMDRERSATDLLVHPTAAEEPVTYAQLDFRIMDALRKTKEERAAEYKQRTEEAAKEEERRKKEEAEKVAKKQGKKKKKDRRNSHQERVMA